MIYIIYCDGYCVQNMHYAQEVRYMEARAEAVRIGVSSCPDGALHPHYESMRERIPVSRAEKKWLFDYFEAMGEQAKSGNYYR